MDEAKLNTVAPIQVVPSLSTANAALIQEKPDGRN
jgi:hypothetical protein